jgi:YD repeat-containing protein
LSLASSSSKRSRQSNTFTTPNRKITDTTVNGTRTYTYDKVGNQLSAIDRNGRKREWTYDARDRVTKEDWFNGTTIAKTINYSYNFASDLTKVNDNISSYAYTYDRVGHLTQVDNLGTPGTPQVQLGYSYNSINNLTRVTDTIGGGLSGTKTYQYDERNRVTRINESGTGITTKRVDMTYDIANQITSLTRLLGTTATVKSLYTYDADGHLSGLNHSKGATVLANYTLSYDAADRITRIVSAQDGTSQFTYNGIIETFSWDHRNRLTRIVTKNGAGTYVRCL